MLATGSALTAALLCSACLSDTSPGRQDPASDPAPMTADEFDRIFDEHSNWGRWGTDDELGALNLVTPEHRRQAAALVRSGVSVSLSHNR